MEGDGSINSSNVYLHPLVGLRSGIDEWMIKAAVMISVRAMNEDDDFRHVSARDGTSFHIFERFAFNPFPVLEIG
jgi:hypothetical protein